MCMFGLQRRHKKNRIKKTLKLPIIKQKGIDLFIDNTGTKVEIKFGNAQHIGGRLKQEDSFGYSNISDSMKISQKGVLAVLADGMGGLSYGKEISEYVVSAALSMFENLNYSQPFYIQIENIIRKINNEVSNRFSKNGKSDAGSTIVLAFIYKTKLYWASVGDSRLYLLRDGYLYQINEDHDYLNHLLEAVINGNITLTEALADPQKNSLTSFIGNEKLPYIDISLKGFSIQRGDKIILCSDGVYNSISDAEFIELLKKEPQVSADRIIRSIVSKKLNNQDNITIMIINYD